MGDQVSVDRILGQLEGALGPLVDQVDDLAKRLNDLIADTNRRHEENIILHSRDKAEMCELIVRSTTGVKLGSDAAIATLSANLNARLQPLEDEHKARINRRKSKSAALAKLGVVAAIGAALQSSWGAIKTGLIWMLMGHK